MPRTRIAAAAHEAPRTLAAGPAVRTLTLAGATLATGFVAGVFYAYAVSVNLGLAAQSDASYVATMRTINERIQNPLFFLSFFGAVLALLAALAAHSPRPRSGRFRLVALACALYLGGGFLLTRGRLPADGLRERAAERAPRRRRRRGVRGRAGAGEGRVRRPVELLERRARGVLVVGVPRPRQRLPATGRSRSPTLRPSRLTPRAYARIYKPLTLSLKPTRARRRSSRR